VSADAGTSARSAASEPAAPGLLAAAVERLRRGGLVAYPTETLYGLGADARSAAAVRRLQAWKGRGEAQPLSVLAAGVDALGELGLRPSPGGRRLLEALWPGPLTAVLPCEGGSGGSRGRFAPGVARPGDGAVGVRCSPHPVARGLARALAAAGAGPVTATSLNRHGERPAARRDAALALCGGGAAHPGRGREAREQAELGTPWLLAPPDAPEPGGIASTVVDATGAEPRILREGAISRAAVEAAWAGRDPGGTA